MIRKNRDQLDSIERSIRIVRDVLLLAGGILLAVIFIPIVKDLGLRLVPQNIQEITVGPVSLKLRESITAFAPPSIPIEAVGGNATMLEKGSLVTLRETLSFLQSTKNARIDVLTIVPQKRYSGDLLQKYISVLNIKFIVFKTDKLEGWIDSSSFSGQIKSWKIYTYDDLKDEIIGINNEYVVKSASTMDVLRKMQELHIDNIAVVNDNRKFEFMASRNDVLSKVLTSALVSESKTN